MNVYLLKKSGISIVAMEQIILQLKNGIDYLMILKKKGKCKY